MVAINDNTTLPLQDVLTQINGLDRRDYASESQLTTVVPKGDGTNSLAIAPPEGSHLAAFDFPLNRHANIQLNQRWAGFNTLSRDLARREWDDIYIDTVNTLLHRDERKLIIRTIDPTFSQRTVRAVVSDAFKPIDDNWLVPKLVDVVGDHADKWTSLGGQLTDTNTHIKFITRDPQFRLQSPDGKARDLHIGFQYSNSEVGSGYAQFSAFLFDSYCSNGCIFGKVIVADVKYAHRGRRVDVGWGRITDDALQHDQLTEIQAAVKAATTLAVEGSYVGEVKLLIERTLNNPIPEGTNTHQFIKLIGKNAGLSQQEQEDTLLHYDGTDTQFGVQAAITKLAQNVPTYSRRIELEEAGGTVMSMNDNTWKSIAAMAA